jgi:hypothetical protein
LTILTPVLDHVVVDVRDRLDLAVETYGGLGFTLTDRGRHTLGSANHLAMFASNYLELLGWEGGKPPRPEMGLERFPAGLNGLVFNMDDADELFARLTAAGLPAVEPMSFSRPVALAGGVEDARFRTIRFQTGFLQNIRFYFCQHLTRELVWRDEWLTHKNGTADIVRVVLVAEDATRLASLFATICGTDRVTATPAGATLRTENATIDIVRKADLDRMFGSAAPDLGGRDECMAALTLKAPGLPARRVLPAAQCLNVTLEFVP